MVLHQLKKQGQISESFAAAIFLTLSGGFQDAYTYCCRDNVFANAQTGNIVMMSPYLFKGDWPQAIQYLIPLCAFITGIFIAELIHRHFKYLERVHWRQLILLLEILLLFSVGFIPSSRNILANAIVSFVCALQVQTFRKVGANSYASTMCIGNLRSGTEALCTYLHTKDNALLKKSAEYFAVICLFTVGAGIGSLLTSKLGIHAIWQSCLLLAVSFCLMFIKNEIKQTENRK